MHAAPTLRSERHHSGTLGTRKHGHHIGHFVSRHVHKHVLFLLGRLYRLNAEEQFVQHGTLLGREVAVGNEHSLALHHHFHLTQIIAHECAAAGHNIENGVRQPDSRANLHRTCDNMYVSRNMIGLHESSQDVGIRSCNLASLKPLEARILDGFGNGQREPTATETQRTHHVCLLLPLFELVLSHNSQISHARCHTLRDVIVAQIEHFDGEIAALHEQRTLAAAHFDARLSKQGHCILKKPTFRLNCDS